jgi:hypothetical protein
MPTSQLRATSMALSVLLLIGVTLPLRAAPARAEEGDKRPNLQMLTLSDWHLQTVNGRRLLRFTSIFVNSGPGAFEVAGKRDSGSDERMDIRQRIFNRDGTSRFIKTRAMAMYAADGHDHWHVHGVVTYEAWKMNDRGSTQRRGGKTGFCFLDSEPWNLGIPGAPQSPVYRGNGCGVRGSLAIQAGLSVGWADNYPWFFAFQWIDITGLPAGTYKVRLTVDIQDYYQERVDTDNCVWTKLRIPAVGAFPKVVANGADCGVDAITPVTHFEGGTRWDPPRRARIEPGPRSGYTFNSAGTVLRVKRVNVQSERRVDVTARGIPPGTGQRYLYMTSGPFAGYWVRNGNGVALLP